MKRQRQRKCLVCGVLFRRTAQCAAPAVLLPGRVPSGEQGGQSTPVALRSRNQDYFRGAESVARVQRWRVKHPGYWRHPGAPAAGASQDDCCTQAIETQKESAFLMGDVLQEVLSTQTLLEIMLLYSYNNIHGVPIKFAALVWRTVKPAHALDA